MLDKPIFQLPDEDSEPLVTQAAKQPLSGSFVGVVREKQSTKVEPDELDRFIVRRAGESLDDYGRRQANEQEAAWEALEAEYKQTRKQEAHSQRLANAQKLRRVYASQFRYYSKLCRSLESGNGLI